MNERYQHNSNGDTTSENYPHDEWGHTSWENQFDPDSTASDHSENFVDDIEDDIDEEQIPRMRATKIMGKLAVRAAKATSRAGASTVTKTKNHLKQKWNDHKERKELAELDYEDQIESRSIEDLLTDDIEILGEKKRIFRDKYYNEADAIIKKIRNAERDINKAGYQEKYLEYRKNAISNKINRLQDSVSRSSESFFSKQLNRQRRQKIEALNYKSKIISKRASNLEQKRINKPEEYQKKIDKIVQNKIDAQYRKAQRKFLKEEHGIGRMNFMDRAKFMSSLSADDKKKIVRGAILEVRKNNIKKDRLDTDYNPQDYFNQTVRKVNEYGRIIR